MDKEKLKKLKRPISSVARPVIGEAGKTGNWRTLRPIVVEKKCIMVKSGKFNCLRCWLYCPESCNEKKSPPKIDLDYCKGCSVCTEECPPKAIIMEEESKFLEEK